MIDDQSKNKSATKSTKANKKTIKSAKQNLSLKPKGLKS
jgi:hypothetical protein